MKDLFFPVTPMNDMPKGSLVYLEFNVTPTGAQPLFDEPLSGGEQITYYEQEYELLKYHLLEEEKDVLLKAIYCRMNKIRRDYCE
jgi:hypothetical protein